MSETKKLQKDQKAILMHNTVLVEQTMKPKKGIIRQSKNPDDFIMTSKIIDASKGAIEIFQEQLGLNPIGYCPILNEMALKLASNPIKREEHLIVMHLIYDVNDISGLQEFVDESGEQAI